MNRSIVVASCPNKVPKKSWMDAHTLVDLTNEAFRVAYDAVIREIDGYA